MSAATLDIYGCVRYLWQNEHQGVRDYLVNQLHEFSVSEIEQVLFQLCNLYMNWTPQQSAGLKKLLMDVSAMSMHVGLKLVWLLTAEVQYSLGSRKDRAIALLRSCEESIVNSKLDTVDLLKITVPPRPPGSEDFDAPVDNGQLNDRIASRMGSSSARAPESKLNPALRTSTPPARPERRRDDFLVQHPPRGSPLSSPNVPPGSPAATTTTSAVEPAHDRETSVSISATDAVDDTDRVAAQSGTADSANSAEREGPPPTMSQSAPALTELSTNTPAPVTGPSGTQASVEATLASSTASLDTALVSKSKSGAPENISIKQFLAQSTTDAAVPVVATGRSPSASTPMGQSEKDLLTEIYLAKQIRLEYFNAELSFMTSLDEISTSLICVPRDQRTPVLRGYIKTLDELVARGLYFPDCNVTAPHYRILRVPPSEAFCLNSRDKAPFLMHLEVAPTGRLCGARDVFRAFDMEEVDRRRTQDTPHYEPVDVNENAAKTVLPLDAHLQQGAYFDQDKVRTPMVERRRGSADTALSARSAAGSDSEDTVWVRMLPNGAATEDIMSGSLALGPEFQLNDSYFDPSRRRSSGGPGGSASARLLAASDARRASTAGTATASPRTDQMNALMAAFGEPWAQRVARVRASSPCGSEPGWQLMSCIYKGGDDCRQEALAMQLIQTFDEIFRKSLPLKLRPYNVLVTSPTSGVIETVPNATSIDSLKKNVKGFTTLAKFFEDCWGNAGTTPAGLDRAHRNFAESMAAYCIVCYLLQIKDRHNGNIMLDRDGHIIHIDFGFMLSNSPGRNVNWESSPFKLTREYVEVMGGEDGETFAYFKSLVIRGFLEARVYSHRIILLVETSQPGSNMACFLAGASTVAQLKERFALTMSSEQLMEHVNWLIDESVDHWTSKTYDDYQRMTNGIL